MEKNRQQPMEPLIDIVRKNKSRLVERAYRLAIRTNYGKFVPAVRECCRTVVQGISEVVLLACQNPTTVSELDADAYSSDPGFRFGEEEAAECRGNGTGPNYYLGLFKQCRQCFHELVRDGDFEREVEARYLHVLERVFDRFELGFSASWHATSARTSPYPEVSGAHRAGDGHTRSLFDPQEIEERYRIMFEDHHAVMLIIDPRTGVIEDANSAACKYYGYSREKITAMRISDINILPEEEVFQEMQRARTKERNRFRFKHRLESGTVSDVEVYTGPVTIAGQQRLFSIIHDVTERVKAETALKESAELLKTTGWIAKIGGWAYDLESGEWTFTDELRSIVGLPPDQKIDLSTALRFIHPEDRQKVEDTVRKMLKTGDDYDMEVRLTIADRKEQYVRSIGRVHTENGKIVRLAGIVQDITAYKEVKRERDMFFDLSVDLVCVASLDGYFRQLSPSWSKALGWTEEELMAKPYIEFVHPEDVGSTQEVADRLAEGQNVFSFDNRYIDRDGAYRWLSWNAYVDTDSGLIFAAARDIQERREMIEELLEKTRELVIAKDAAEMANRAKSEFLANMSHEIRTPLNAVTGFSELLTSLVTDDRQKDYLGSIKTAGRSLLTLINDILDLSKIEAGMMEIAYNPVDPHIIFKEIEQIFAMKVAEKGLSFSIHIDEALPRTLMLDETRLRQVLLNIVGNAVKFTEKGSVRLSIRKLLGVGSNEEVDLEISVEDSGIGIPEEEVDTVFESFKQQTGQSSKKYGGTGLGLSISKKLVEIMNGEIAVSSRLGTGSVFRITLRAVEVALPEPVPERRRIFDYKQLRFDRERILVVDDVESNRRLLEEILSAANLDVLVAENGQEGIIMTREFSPHLVVLDIRMPIMDGFEAIKVLKEDPRIRKVPIVALTASAQSEDRERMLAAGFNGYIPKPVDMADLFRELVRYLPYTEIGKKEAETGEKRIFVDNLSEETVERISELSSVLTNEILPKVETSKGAVKISDVSDLGKRISELGRDHNSQTLDAFGDRLYGFSQRFDIKNIRLVLQEFGLIVDSVQKKTKET
ncbi:MAG: PAS domain S-box protein [Proteobacteria bacterium]|nr:PAS domain S-box protein [Pseudomonadota bacterium]